VRVNGTYTFKKWIVWVFVAGWALLMVGAIGQWFVS
jgi:hypothetical protein